MMTSRGGQPPSRSICYLSDRTCDQAAHPLPIHDANHCKIRLCARRSVWTGDTRLTLHEMHRTVIKQCRTPLRLLATRVACAGVMGTLSPVRSVASASEPDLVVRSFLADPPICRAGRPIGLTAVVVNNGTVDADVTASLSLPPGLRLVAPTAPALIRMAATEGERRLHFIVEAAAGGPAEIGLDLSSHGTITTRHPLRVTFLPPLAIEQRDVVPSPKPVATDILVGAIHCPIWESDRVDLWRGVLRHPERLPALGLYAQENPQVAEWEAKWALEHGISFFVYCWYRRGQGEPVQTQFGRGLLGRLAVHQRLGLGEEIGQQNGVVPGGIWRILMLEPTEREMGEREELEGYFRRRSKRVGWMVKALEKEKAALARKLGGGRAPS